jgi:hypothetical protein
MLGHSRARSEWNLALKPEAIPGEAIRNLLRDLAVMAAAAPVIRQQANHHLVWDIQHGAGGAPQAGARRRRNDLSRAREARRAAPTDGVGRRICLRVLRREDTVRWHGDNRLDGAAGRLRAR